MTEQSLPDLIRAYMQDHGYSQAEMARRIGIPNQTLNGVMTKKWARPSIENRRRIAAVLGLTHLDILVAIGDISAEEGKEGITAEAEIADPDPRTLLSRQIRNLSDADLGIIREHVEYLLDRAARNRSE